MTVPPPSPRDPELVAALELSKQLGMLGRRPIAAVIEQADAFVGALAGLRSGSLVVDLGSGGGVPGLVVARSRPDLAVVLVDRRATRVDHLRRLIRRLDLSRQVEALAVEAAALPEYLSRPPDAVVARGFGAPHKLLEAAVPLLGVDAVIAASAPPPGAVDRWPDELLHHFGVVRVPCDPRLVLVRVAG